MAFAATTLWDVSTGGDDTNNGGGFDAAASGTDFSNQDAAQVTYTDLVIDGADNTKITSAGNPFDGTSPGNIISITSGTGFTVQRVQIVSVAAGVATCDKAVGTIASTGGNGRLGGRLATVALAFSLMVAGNDVHIKSGTYQHTSSAQGTPAAGGVNRANMSRIVGYGSSRGDGGTAPIIQANANNVVCYTPAASTYTENVHFDGNKAARTGTRCLNLSLTHTTFVYCRFYNATAAFSISSSLQIFFRCQADNNNAAGFTLRSTSVAVECISFANAGAGFQTSVSTAGPATYIRCVAYGNTATGGFDVPYSSLENCVAYGNTGYGFRVSNANTDFAGLVRNCIAVNNTTYAFTAGYVTDYLSLINCAHYNNSSGLDTTNITRTLGTVALTGDPFTNAAGADFSLNNTAGAGADCRAAGVPGVLGSSTGYLDIGAVQHADPAGGAGIARLVGGGLVH